jgi:hypothetical protein
MSFSTTQSRPKFFEKLKLAIHLTNVELTKVEKTNEESSMPVWTLTL